MNRRTINYTEADRVASVLYAVTKGNKPRLYHPKDTLASCQAARVKLGGVPRGGVLIPFSKQEMRLLRSLAVCGLVAVEQATDATTSQERSIMRAIMRRITDAYNDTHKASERTVMSHDRG